LQSRDGFIPPADSSNTGSGFFDGDGFKLPIPETLMHLDYKVETVWIFRYNVAVLRRRLPRLHDFAVLGSTRAIHETLKVRPAMTNSTMCLIGATRTDNKDAGYRGPPATVSPDSLDAALPDL